jgi:hypothetical protein
MMRDGNLATVGAGNNPAVAESNFYQALMAMAMPYLWSTDSTRRPVILSGAGMPLKSAADASEGGCRENPGAAPVSMTSDVWEPTFWCWQGENGPESYWMVHVRTNCETSGRDQICLEKDWQRINVPKGWDTIDGEQWGGLQRGDLFKS